MPAFDAYFDFKESLEAVFGRPIDLAMLGAVRNPCMRIDIERSWRPFFSNTA